MRSLTGTVVEVVKMLSPFYFFFLMFIYFETDWEKASTRKQGRGRKRSGQRIRSGLQADSREPNAGLELRKHKIMTWAKVRRLTSWATRAPHHFLFYMQLYFLHFRSRHFFHKKKYFHFEIKISTEGKDLIIVFFAPVNRDLLSLWKALPSCERYKNPLFLLLTHQLPIWRCMNSTLFTQVNV